VCGERNNGPDVREPAFHIVHWNGSDFISRGIPVSRYSDDDEEFTGLGEIEGSVFAPTNLLPLLLHKTPRAAPELRHCP